MFTFNRFNRLYYHTFASPLLNTIIQQRQISLVRGTHDLLPEDKRKRRIVEESARYITSRYGYEEIETPVLEHAELFQKSLGEESDVVKKEMYIFKDNSDNAVALRPENTAGIVRAFVADGVRRGLPQKYFYTGPMFRYERPQKGRSRQFNQVGVELLGESHPSSDAEVLCMASKILQKLKLYDRMKLEINSLGDTNSRQTYRTVLQKFFADKKDKLSQDSQQRLERGSVLRILDSKDPEDQVIVKTAPVLEEFLSKDSKLRFKDVLETLETLKIPYFHNPYLVRGLDYYCHTIFEFTSNFGNKSLAVLAGGRYDQLVKQMGGPDTPAIGWAAGTERLELMLEDICPTIIERNISVIAVREDDDPTLNKVTKLALQICSTLRDAGFPVVYSYTGNVSKQMKKANKHNCIIAVIVGDNEVEKQEATIKLFDTGKQVQTPLSSLAASISALLTNSSMNSSSNGNGNGNGNGNQNS